jgi:hypothetical protein
VIPCVPAAGSLTSVRKSEIRGLDRVRLQEHGLHTGLLGSLGFGESLERALPLDDKLFGVNTYSC